MDFLTAIKELRQTEKRKFNQTVDLIINLKNYDLRTKPINIFIDIPHQFKRNKICAFLESTSSDVDKVVSKEDISAFKEKKDIKNLAKDYDFFISSIKLMPLIANSFGKILGPLGKMPNPKFGGVLMKEEPILIKNIAEKLRKMINIKAKEVSIKIAAGKESMKDEEITENINAIYNALLAAVTRENVKSIYLKLTMSKPIKLK